MAQTNKPQRERVLIIIDLRHAERVRDAALDYKELAEKTGTLPTESRIAAATARALQAIFQRSDGWHDTEFRVALSKMILPRLSRDELNRIMNNVYEVVPRREETDNIARLRQERRDAKLASKS